MKVSMPAIVAIAVASGFLHFFFSVPIFETGPDALNQIVGAYNIHLGNGYVLENGESISYWPPLYSIYASLFVSVFHNFTGIAIANSILISAVAFSWSFFIYSIPNLLIQEDRNQRPPDLLLLSLIIAASLTAVYLLRAPSSDAVFAFAFPLYLHSLINLSVAGFTAARGAKLVTITVVSVNSHNMGVILLLATTMAFFPVFALMNRSVSKSATLIIAGATGLGSWLAVRHFFNLGSSHEFEGLFGADRTVSSAAFDLIRGPVHLLFSAYPPLGVLLIAAAIAGAMLSFEKIVIDKSTRETFCALLGSIAIYNILLFLIFTSVTIHSGIVGRFAMVQVVTLYSIAALIAIPKNRFYPVLIMLAWLPALSSGARIVKWHDTFHVRGLYQWKSSVLLTDRPINFETLADLRRSTCPDYLCVVADHVFP